MFDEHNLDYLDEVTGADVDGLFFVDYILENPGPRWVRSPFMDTRDIAIRFATVDTSEIRKIDIRSLKDLIVPVNADGLSENDCQSASIPFEPLCQRVEWIFGSAYRIDKNMLESHKSGRIYPHHEKGVFMPVSEDGLLIGDQSEIVTERNAEENLEGRYILLDISDSRTVEIKNKIEEITKQKIDYYDLIKDLLDQQIEDVDVLGEDCRLVKHLMDI